MKLLLLVAVVGLIGYLVYSFLKKDDSSSGDSSSGGGGGSGDGVYNSSDTPSSSGNQM